MLFVNGDNLLFTNGVVVYTNSMLFSVMVIMGSLLLECNCVHNGLKALATCEPLAVLVAEIGCYNNYCKWICTTHNNIMLFFFSLCAGSFGRQPWDVQLSRHFEAIRGCLFTTQY